MKKQILASACLLSIITSSAFGSVTQIQQNNTEITNITSISNTEVNMNQSTIDALELIKQQAERMDELEESQQESIKLLQELSEKIDSKGELDITNLDRNQLVAISNAVMNRIEELQSYLDTELARQNTLGDFAVDLSPALLIGGLSGSVIFGIGAIVATEMKTPPKFIKNAFYASLTALILGSTLLSTQKVITSDRYKVYKLQEKLHQQKEKLIAITALLGDA